MIRDELGRLFGWEERHRRLVARLAIAFGLTLVVGVLGTVAVWLVEPEGKASDIHGFGDAAFFVAVQLLTVSSSLRNPLSAAGKVADVLLEGWAVFVITAVAGSFGAFFNRADA